MLPVGAAFSVEARSPNARGVRDLLTVSGPQHAFFSALQPGTHVIAHTGPTNKKLRCHLPLTGVKGSRLRVGGDTREQAEGTCYVFDDSFEHEAWHDGDSTRCPEAPTLETALQRLLMRQLFCPGSTVTCECVRRLLAVSFLRWLLCAGSC